MSRKVRLTRIIGRTGEVAEDLRSLHFSGFRPDHGWQPDANVYRYEDRFEIWVDLAGVERDRIEVDVLPDRVRIAGTRRPPSPSRQASGECLEVLAMEIESGGFLREVRLPREVDRDQVRAKQENGLLCVTLPFASKR